MLHARCRHPGHAGVFLQSGSFFAAALDGQERLFRPAHEHDPFIARLRGLPGPGSGMRAAG